MNPLELYNKYAPFIKGNPAAIYPDLVCLDEMGVNEAIFYIFTRHAGTWDDRCGEYDWRSEFFQEEGGHWEVDIEPKNLLELLCSALIHFNDGGNWDTFPYALISCLYSIPEVAQDSTAMHILSWDDVPAWASNLYRSQYGQVDWSLAETLYLRMEGKQGFCMKYGRHRSR